MKIKLDDLKDVAKDANRELRFLKSLKEELQTKLSYRCVGNTLHSLAKNSNDVLDEKMIFGEGFPTNIRTSFLLECLKSPSVEVRKFSARLLPENLADQVLLHETEDDVIYAAAYKASPKALANLIESRRTDENLFDIAKIRLSEDVDLERAERLKSIVNFGPVPELDDLWYTVTALKLVDQYNLHVYDELPVSKIVKQFADSTASSSKIQIDREKLHKEITKHLDQRLEITEAKDAFASMLKMFSTEEVLSENITVLTRDEDIDELNEITSSDEFLKLFEEQYQVRFYNITSSAITSKGLCESLNSRVINVPGTAWIKESDNRFEYIEKSIDRYVDTWNKRKMPNISSHLKLSWGFSPEHERKISFSLGAK